MQESLIILLPTVLHLVTASVAGLMGGVYLLLNTKGL